MIHESQIKKFYPSDTPIIRRGDKGWTSDADRQREAAATGPLTFHNGDKRPWAKRVEPDYREHIEILEHHRLSKDQHFGPIDVGFRLMTQDGRDYLVFEYKGDGQWRLCYRDRNGAV